MGRKAREGIDVYVYLTFAVEMCAAAKNGFNKLPKPPFWVFKVAQGHRCWQIKKPRHSACYDRQQVCTYLQPFSHYMSQ